MTDDEVFEKALKRDLPRGLEPLPTGVGDRGVRSRWLKPGEMGDVGEGSKAGILLGYREGRIIGTDDNRHLLTIAGSRGYKGVSLIIPNLIEYPGSAVVIDPKGENAAITARRRGRGPKSGAAGLGQNVYVLDPFGESGLEETHSFNPLEALDKKSETLVDDLGLFADALIVHPGAGERYWTESAQALLVALMLVVVCDPRFKKRCNLVTVRRLLALTDPAIEDARILPVGGEVPEELRDADDSDNGENDNKDGADDKDQFADEDRDDEQQRQKSEKLTKLNALFRILEDQEDNTKFYEVAAGVAEQFRAMGSRERGSVLSSARTQTRWIASPKMAPVLTNKSSFAMDQLKREKTTLYLCLPAMRMGTHARWLRLMVMLALMTMERVKVKADPPVLFALDEFAVLGYIESIEIAAGLMAGFGVKLWPILQNIGQLKRHYNETWQTFIANAGVVTAFSVNDEESLGVLSKYLGQTVISETIDTGATSSDLMRGSAAVEEKKSVVPLLAPSEIRRIFGRDEKRALVLIAGHDPAIVKRFVYHSDPYFMAKGLKKYDPDPLYGKAP